MTARRAGTICTMRIIGYGVDIVEVARIASMLETHGQRFVERVFTEAEQAYAESGKRRRVERYAARFAAKEAVLKALGTGWRDGIAWTDIEIRLRPSGQPFVVLSGRCAEIAAAAGIDSWQVSLSHTERYAMAGAIAGGPDGG